MSKREPTTEERIAAEILLGQFEWMKSKPTAKVPITREGDELKKWMVPLLTDHYVNEEFAAEIHFSYPASVPVLAPTLMGPKGASSPPARSFIYLDVGAWIGSKNKPWGRDTRYPDRYLKRDFGVICGPLVALCTFTYAHAGQHCKLWEDNKNSEDEPWKSVAKLVESLSRPAKHEVLRGDEPLGSVIIRDAIFSVDHPVVPKYTEDYVIHFLLGDMHVPVLDDEVQTYGALQQEPEPAFYMKGAPLRLNKREGVEKDFPKRVPRLGRLDFHRIEAIVKALIHEGVDGTKLVRKLVDVAEAVRTRSLATKAIVAADIAGVGTATVGTAAVFSPALVWALAATLGVPVAALTAIFVATEGTQFTSDPGGFKDDLMNRDEAKRWYECYRLDDEGKPADVFEDAGDHVLHLALRLQNYMYQRKYSSAGAPEGERSEKEYLPVRFIQLGDMLDFWVGFTCHYMASSSPDQAIQGMDAQGEKMLKHWTTNLFGHTRQGQQIAKAIDLIKTAQLDPVFLYGNHDNYLGARPSLTYPFNGKDRTLDVRVAQYPNQLGLFIEHGHQWEPSNSDSAGSLGAVSTAIMGTPSPTGIFVTQAAFIRPEPTRGFEGVAAGLVARISGTKGQRLDQIVGAGRRFVENSGGFYCYAMGHTHVACLTKVVVNEAPPEFRPGKVKFAPPTKKILFVKNMQDFTGIEYVPRRSGLNVQWTGLPGSPDAWIALADRLAPRQTPLAKLAKGLVKTSIEQKDGACFFENLPPGIYEARFYASRGTDLPCARSHNAMAVVGLSIEEDPSQASGAAFQFDEKNDRFLRPVILRWAFNPANFDRMNAWFALYRPEEPQESSNYTDRQFAPATSQFSKIMRAHPHWGRWDLSSAHLVFKSPFITQFGAWQVRAFNEARGAQPMATANFTIEKATTRG